MYKNWAKIYSVSARAIVQTDLGTIDLSAASDTNVLVQAGNLDWDERPANVDIAFLPGKVPPLGEYDARMDSPGLRSLGSFPPPEGDTAVPPAHHAMDLDHTMMMGQAYQVIGGGWGGAVAFDFDVSIQTCSERKNEIERAFPLTVPGSNGETRMCLKLSICLGDLRLSSLVRE